jgi:hypothetical protein
MDGAVELILVDDESQIRKLETLLAQLASRCDVLLGPYSTRLMRAAGRIAAQEDRLLWNHGGSGDDVEVGYPGHVISVLAPASRYAEPFLEHLVHYPRAALYIVHGVGSFGRQVAGGAERLAARLGIQARRIGPGETFSPDAWLDYWDLLATGSFEEDIQTVKRAQTLRPAPRNVCAVAAGVREFGDHVNDATGTFGIAQWFPGRNHRPALGPAEADFLAAYPRTADSPLPDYPAIQATAASILGAHCARQTGTIARKALWASAVALDTDTLFGDFKIDAITGSQEKHKTVLVEWTSDGPAVRRR